MFYSHLFGQLAFLHCVLNSLCRPAVAFNLTFPHCTMPPSEKVIHTQTHPHPTPIPPPLSAGMNNDDDDDDDNPTVLPTGCR